MRGFQQKVSTLFHRPTPLHVLLHGGVLLLQPIDFIGENWSDFHHNPQVRDLKRAAGEFGAG